MDKIFRGAKAPDLPFESPIKLELVINLNAAKTFGSTIPQFLMLRAHKVIE